MSSLYSDTPETDDQASKCCLALIGEFVPADFARKLERGRKMAWHSLARIHSIMTSKEERGEDVLLGSTSFKSVKKWASYGEADVADEELRLWRNAAAVIGIKSPEELHGYMQAKLESEHYENAGEHRADARHIFAPDKKYPWFCDKCGYPPEHPVMHLPAAAARGGASESQREADGTDDGKPDGQAENADVDLPDTAAQDSTSKANSPAVSG